MARSARRVRYGVQGCCSCGVSRIADCSSMRCGAEVDKDGSKYPAVLFRADLSGFLFILSYAVILLPTKASI